MFKNDKKINISKTFLIIIFILCLMIAVMDFSDEYSYATQLNETDNNDEVMVVEDNELIGSDREDDSSSELIAQSPPKIITTTGGAFRYLQSTINRLDDGDTIKLQGTFNADENDTTVIFDRNLTFITYFGGILNATGRTSILNITEGAQGCTISNLEFINANGDSGCAIIVGASNVVLNNLKFRNNHCTSGGILKIEPWAKNVTIRNCQFTNNSAYYDNFDNITYASSISVYSPSCNISGCTFNSNWIKGLNGTYAGVIKVIPNSEGDDVIITKCVFRNNRAISTSGSSYGGVCIVDEYSKYINCSFINNTACCGGAVVLNFANNLINSTFTNNNAVYGGAILSNITENGALEIRNLKFEENSAVEGGACYLNQDNIKIIDSVFNKNNATYGGALKIQSNNITVKNSTFTANMVNKSGGAIFIGGDDVKILNSTFLSNIAIHNDSISDSGLGGAIYVGGSQSVIDGCEFKFNQAKNGSAIYFDKKSKNISLTGNNFHDNHAYIYRMSVDDCDIYYGDVEQIKLKIYYGDNIASPGSSNSMYGDADIDEIKINGKTPSLNPSLTEAYQSSLANNISISLTVQHEDGTIAYNNSLNSTYLGEIYLDLENLKIGNYNVIANYLKYAYYEPIVNISTFKVSPKVDNQIKISSNSLIYNLTDVIIWTVNITNNGPNNASDVIVYCMFDDGLIYQNDDGNGLYDFENAIINISRLDVGQTITVNINTTVNKTGEFKYGANISSQALDVNSSNNYDSQLITVNPASELSVLMYVNTTNCNYEDMVNWTVKVKNNGIDNVTDVLIKNNFSESLILIDFTQGYDLETDSWTVDKIGVNEEITLNFITLMNNTGLIENEVTVYSSNFDYNSLNNKDNKSVLVNVTSDLEITLHLNSSSVNYHDLITFTLSIKNNGLNNASNVTVEDILPEGFIYLNSSLNYTNNKFYIGNLSVNQTVEINMSCMVNTTGNHINQVNISGCEYDYNLTNNINSISIHIGDSSDLEITNTVNSSDVKYHDLVNWTITVKNNGPDIAYDVVVNDLFKDSLIYVDDTSNGSYNCTTGQWKIDELGVGKTISLTITSKVNATGIIVNQANVTLNNYDYYLLNNNASNFINVGLASDLEIKYSVNASNVNYMDLVKFTITVRNNGIDNATGIKINSILPEGFIYQDSTLEYVNDSFEIDNLPVDSNITVELYCKVNTTGNCLSSVNVSCMMYDYNMINNNAHADIMVNNSCDLEISKTFSSIKPRYMDFVNLTLNIKNNGPNDAHNVVVYDLLSDLLMYIDDDSNDEYDCQNGIWNVGDLGIGVSRNLTIQCKIIGTGILVNDINVKSAEYDYNPVNNNDTCLLTINNSADLSISMSVNSSDVYNHDLVKLTLTVKNNGINNATGIRIVNMLPDGLSYVDSILKFTNGIFYIENLNVGEEFSLNIVLRADNVGSYLNMVELSLNEYDYNSDNNNDSVLINVNPVSDLKVITSFNSSDVNFGDVVELTVSVKNNGLNDADNVMVLNKLPDELIYNSSSNNYDYIIGIWNVGDLKVNETCNLTVKCKVNKTGLITSNVNISFDGYDPILDNNNYSVSLMAKPVVDLAIMGYINATKINYGDLIRLTIIVSNNGLNTASGVKIISSLPNSLVYDDSNINRIINVEDLGCGENVTFNMDYRVINTGNYTVNINVTSDTADSNLDNNNESISISIDNTVDLEINSYVNVLNPKYGDGIDLTLIVKNNGLNKAGDVKVTAVLSDLLSYLNDSSNNNYYPNTGIWNVGDLDVNEKANLTISCKVNNVGKIENHVNVTCSEYDYNLTNNYGSIVLTTQNYADLSLKTSVNTSSIYNNGLVKLTVTVKNNGIAAGEGVKIINTLPVGFVYADSILTFTNGVFYIGNLDVNEEISLDMILKANKIGNYIDTVNVTCENTDLNLNDNSASVSINVNPVSDLEVITSVSSSNPKFGDNVDLTITVKNNGLNDAEDVVVLNKLPDSLAYVSSTKNYNSLTGVWNVGDLKVNETSNLTIRAKINKAGLIINNASVTFTGHDSNLGNNNDFISIIANSVVDLAIQGKINSTKINYGDLIKLTVTVINKGYSDASGVKVFNILPSELSYANPYLDGVFSIGNLACGKTSTLEIVYRVIGTGNFISNINVVSNENDSDLTNNFDSISINVNNLVDLEVKNSINNTNPNYHDFIDLTITVKNNGIDDAYGVVVSDLLSESLVYVSSDKNYDYSNGKWNVGFLKVNEIATLTIKCRVNKTGLIFNNVNVTSSDDESNLLNNFDNISINVNPSCDLSVSLNINQTALYYGDYVNLTINIKNNGLNDAFDVKVINVLPVALINVDDLAGDAFEIERLGSGENLTYVLTCQVINIGNFTDTVNITSRIFDYNLNNNMYSIPINVNHSVDLDIISSFSNDEPEYHEIIELTINVKNNALDGANNVSAYVLLSDSLEYINDTSNGFFNPESGIWKISNLDAGCDMSLTVQCKVNKTGVIESYVNVTSSEYDHNLENNEFTDLIVVGSSCDLVVVSKINATEINYHDLVKLRLTISNIGLNNATDINIRNILPDALEYINSTWDYENNQFNILKLCVGENQTIDIVCKVTGTGNYVNEVNVVCEESDSDMTNNHYSLPIVINHASDLEIINKINKTQLKYGDLVNWTVIIKNNGPDKAHNISISNLIPEILSTIDVISNNNGGDGIWDIDSISVGEEIEFNVIGIVDMTGLFKTNMSVNAFEYDYNIINNENNDVISVDRACDLSIQMSINKTDINYLDVLKLTLTLTNIGPDNATDVRIDYMLPQQLIFIDSTFKYENNIFEIGNISSEQSINIDIIVKVNKTGNYISTAKVYGSQEDYYLNNNQVSIPLNVSSASDLEVIMMSDTSKLKSDKLINLIINVKNNGLDDACGVLVSDILPDSLIYLGDDSNGSYSPQTGIWNISSLKNNEEKTLNISAKVNSTGLIKTHVNITSFNFDFNSNNNKHDLEINVDSIVDLLVSSSFNQSDLNYGDLVKWTVIASNKGLNNATNVEIKQNLSKSLILINFTVSNGSYVNGTWKIDLVEINGVETLEFVCKINKTGSITNEVSIKSVEYDEDLSNNNASSSINISKTVDIEVIQFINDTNPRYGENITLVISVKNNGPDNASNVYINNLLNDSLIMIKYNASKGYYINNVWNISSLNAGETDYINITCSINSTGLINNNINVNSPEFDLNYSNNQNSIQINATAIVDVYIEEYVNNTSLNYGDLVKFTIVVSNKGINKATGIQIKKHLPEGLILINTTLTKGTYDEDVWYECCLEKDEVQTLEMICKVNKTGLITYNVSISSIEQDENQSNNNATVTLTIPEIVNDNNNTKSNTTENISVKNQKSEDDISISVKKTTSIKKSSKVTNIKITLKGAKTVNKLKVKFKFKDSKNVKVKLDKSLKGKKVTILFKNKKYMVKVNKNGIGRFKLNKNLKKGKYYYGIVSWKGFKVYKNKKITVKFNGKSYTVKTNKYSIATLKVTKKMVKNLKKGKTYNYSVNYKNIDVDAFVKIK